MSFAIGIKNFYLKEKRRIIQNSNIPPSKKYNLQKNPLKRNQNPSSYYNSIINLKFPHKPKYHLFFPKNPHIKIDLLLLPRGQNPFSYYIL